MNHCFTALGFEHLADAALPELVENGVLAEREEFDFALQYGPGLIAR